MQGETERVCVWAVKGLGGLGARESLYAIAGCIPLRQASSVELFQRLVVQRLVDNRPMKLVAVGCIQRWRNDIHALLAR